KCGDDGPQFKGIFIRNLAYLHQVSPNPRYKAFIVKNTASLLSNSRNDRHQFGLSWSSQFDRADAARQSAALDALNASILLRSSCRAEVSDRAVDRAIPLPLFSAVPTEEIKPLSFVPTQSDEVQPLGLTFQAEINPIEPSWNDASGLIAFLATLRSLQ
ncbi:MAG TPA: hypothetical protein VL134_13620, partial [Leptolyngbya sp.]|nr:hypothetical protein [Leptolyngbya sp.]